MTPWPVHVGLRESFTSSANAVRLASSPVESARACTSLAPFAAAFNLSISAVILAALSETDFATAAFDSVSDLLASSTAEAICRLCWSISPKKDRMLALRSGAISADEALADAEFGLPAIQIASPQLSRLSPWQPRPVLVVGIRPQPKRPAPLRASPCQSVPWRPRPLWPAPTAVRM